MAFEKLTPGKGADAQVPRFKGLPFLPLALALALSGLLPAVGAAVPCTQPDNGTGTVDLPPEGCEYLSPQEVHMIIDGLPPGTTIELDPIHTQFLNVTRYPGGTLGGEVEEFESYLFLEATGTGDLAGFHRSLVIPIGCEVHTGPRNPGDPVQEFLGDMFRLEGGIFGDPDFDLLSITAGTGNGFPSPGQTTLTDLGGGLYNIDSFFDITYQIDFTGAPGSQLEGLSGVTTATIRMETGEPAPPPTGACCYPDGTCLPAADESECPTGVFLPETPCDPNPCPQPVGACCFPSGMCVETTSSNCPTGDWLPDTPCEPNPCPQPPEDCVEPDNGEGTVNLPPEDCQYLSPTDVHLLIEGLPPGTTIELDPIHDRFTGTQRTPGGNLGGEIETFDSRMIMSIRGTGELEGFLRVLEIPVACEVHTGSRNPGDPVQDFDNEMVRLQGGLAGDPDFDYIDIVAGGAFGLPSPGHTTLTDLGGGLYNIDSFFDISYQIDFSGAPGGALDGYVGVTTGVVRMDTGETIPSPLGACCYPDGTCIESTFEGCPTGDFRVYEVCTPNPCPQPEDGACCFPSGMCVETTFSNCPTGDWLPATPCEPNPCPQHPEDCVEPDNGEGTVNLPPEDCAYLSPEDVHLIIEGLPPGTTIELDPIHDRFTGTQRTPGGLLGGEIETFDSRLQLAVRGTGDLEGFLRLLDVILACEVHTGPRQPGDAVQEFGNEMVRLQGAIFGDPDFDLLVITAGRDFGHPPSPGQTTLTDLGGGLYNVDSFFDITYQIDFVGAPGSLLDGLAGSTVGTVRMDTGETIPPPPGACCYPDGTCIETTFENCPTGDFRAYEVCDPNPCPQPQTGACCFPSGMCVETALSGCPTGNWIADTPCDPNPCPQPPEDCVEPDNGAGTVNLPPEDCAYLSPDDVHLMIEGLPPGTTIELDPIHDRFINTERIPGGPLGGEVEIFDSSLHLDVRGTGDLEGFLRTLDLQLTCEVHTGPRQPGDAVQPFLTDMFRLYGDIGAGDPDFESLVITAGTGFGMPSPGHTTLTELPSGEFNVDSFFDISYQIDFVGAPGSQLDGLAGSTTGTIRMDTGETVPPPSGACCFPDGGCLVTLFPACPTDDFRAYEVCDPNPCPQPSGDCVEPDNGTGTVDLPPESCRYLSPADVHLIIEGLPPGTTIELDPIHDRFINVTRTPGGTLGGEVEEFDSSLLLEARGTGELEGFNRTLEIPLACEVHTGPRNPGDPVQSFPNDMYRLQGAIFGDPDFDLLRITAGTSFDMPSPGHTILIDQGRGDFTVDSFFDITYTIEFIGAPGSQLEDLAGATMGTIWMGVGSLNIPEEVEEDQPILRGRLEAHPNPFYPTTTIYFTLDSPGLAELQIFDVAGRMVRNLAKSSLSAGTHQAIWDGRDAGGSSLKSGVYFCQLRVDGRLIASKRALLLK